MAETVRLRVLVVMAVAALAASLLLTLVFAAPPGSAQTTQEGTASATVTGELKKWHPVTLSFAGPQASETDNSPNPFLDYRLQVTLTGPTGQNYIVPGFFDGDGQGGASGDVWRVRFSPDQAGTWSYKASFRQGTDVAIDLSPTAGTPTSFDGASGTFEVAERDPTAPGFLKWGRLEYVGGHYLKFRDGSYWLKGGANVPENWLGYMGFDNTPQAHHSFSPHVGDWKEGDPVFNTTSPDGGKGLVGAMNYLSSQKVNSIYFLPMNIGGEMQDTSPYVGPIDWLGSSANDNKHFDISKLGQWEAAFSHAQRQGLYLHFVLGEDQVPNKRELDNSTLGVERKVYYRELVARFGHQLALQWNLCEEYEAGNYPYTPDQIKQFAGYIQQLDPYDHPITVHNRFDPDGAFTPFLGDSRISITSMQYAGAYAGYGDEVEEWRQKTVAAGRPLTISMDELAAASVATMDHQRRTVIWPTYLSGGQLELFIRENSADCCLEDFRTYERLWTYMRYARSFVEENLPFWEMEPRDELLTGESTDNGGGQVFAKPGQVYAVSMPNTTSTGSLDLSGVSGEFQKRWFNPRTGTFEGATQTVTGGGKRSLGTPPSSIPDDWVVLFKKVEATKLSITLTTPPDGATYSLNQTVNANYTCQDGTGGSGVKTCEGTVPNGNSIDTSSGGTKTFTVNATDNAGNTTSVTHSYTVNACTITGTSGNDVLEGTEGADTICGLGGSDTIRGLGGNDTLQGGDGSDTLEGGAGDDVLKGENNNDKLYGGDGNDTIDGGAGSDTASFRYSATGVQASLVTQSATGEGSDTIAAIEHLEGSQYIDTLTGSPSTNNLTGLSGADTLSGGDGADKLTGVSGNDTLYGGLGNDTITGQGGADTHYGEDGDDTLNSQDGVNGNDSLDGGAGTDTCTTDSTEKSIVSCP